MRLFLAGCPLRTHDITVRGISIAEAKKMWRKFVLEEEAASTMEYIVLSALGLAILATAAWALLDAVGTKGDETRASIESQIPTPP